MTKFDKLFNSILNEEIELRRPRDVVTISHPPEIPRRFGSHRTEYGEIRKREEIMNNSIEVNYKNWEDEVLKKYPNAKFKYFLPGLAKINSGTMATIDNMVVGATGGHYTHEPPWKAYIFKTPITQKELYSKEEILFKYIPVTNNIVTK